MEKERKKRNRDMSNKIKIFGSLHMFNWKKKYSVFSLSLSFFCSIQERKKEKKNEKEVLNDNDHPPPLASYIVCIESIEMQNSRSFFSEEKKPT
jgi:hypothetical protein